MGTVLLSQLGIPGTVLIDSLIALWGTVIGIKVIFHRRKTLSQNMATASPNGASEQEKERASLSFITNQITMVSILESDDVLWYMDHIKTV